MDDKVTLYDILRAICMTVVLVVIIFNDDDDDDD